MGHAVRGAWDSGDNVFLIGLEHLDLGDQDTLEEIRMINGAFTNAIAKDVSDRGNALAEKIDQIDGTHLATGIAKTLLMSSLSSAEDPQRGLREGELYEALVGPLVKVSDLKPALEKYVSQAWYLQKDIQDRIYVSQTANVTAEINEIAENIPDELVDDTLRKKLREVFKPRTAALYDADMAVLPALDTIEVPEDRGFSSRAGGALCRGRSLLRGPRRRAPIHSARRYQESGPARGEGKGQSAS